MQQQHVPSDGIQLVHALFQYPHASHTTVLNNLVVDISTKVNIVSIALLNEPTGSRILLGDLGCQSSAILLIDLKFELLAPYGRNLSVTELPDHVRISAHTVEKSDLRLLLGWFSCPLPCPPTFPLRVGPIRLSGV